MVLMWNFVVHMRCDWLVKELSLKPFFTFLSDCLIRVTVKGPNGV
jgi:hypothetical protein